MIRSQLEKISIIRLSDNKTVFIETKNELEFIREYENDKSLVVVLYENEEYLIPLVNYNYPLMFKFEDKNSKPSKINYKQISDYQSGITSEVKFSIEGKKFSIESFDFDKSGLGKGSSLNKEFELSKELSKDKIYTLIISCYNGRDYYEDRILDDSELLLSHGNLETESPDGSSSEIGDICIYLFENDHEYNDDQTMKILYKNVFSI